MGFIKKSWKWIVGIIGFFIGLVWIMNTNSSKKVKKIKRILEVTKIKPQKLMVR